MDYTNKFRELATDLGYNDAALIGYYRQGLKEEVLDGVLDQKDIPTTFEGFAAEAIKIDNRKFARALDKKQRSVGGIQSKSASTTQSTAESKTHTQTLGQYGRQASVGKHSASDSNTPTPMELGLVKHISAEERTRRKEKDACYYCGGTDHWATKCPAKKTHLASANTTSTPAIGSETDDFSFHLGKEVA